MGWGSGSDLMSSIIDETKSAIKDTDTRLAFYKQMIHLFQMKDCDTLDECREQDPVFDQSLDDMEWNK